MEDLLDYQVDGIIAASVGMSNDLTRRCAAAEIPIVLFNRAQDDDRLFAGTSGSCRGGCKMAEFLVAGGHSRIAHVAGRAGAPTRRDREAGFVAGPGAAAQSLFARYVSDFQFDRSGDVARERIADPDRPDAVFCASGHMAFVVMDVLRFGLGLSMPADGSVAGCDDVALSTWPSHDLTTMRQPAGQMAQAAIDIQMDRLADPDAKPRRVALDGPLILRGSARIPRGWTA